MEQFLDPDFIKFFIPLGGAVIAWFINEYRKQKSDEYQRKEMRYLELMKALKGFYVSAFADLQQSISLKRNFIDHLEQCWLYCPDEVIQKGYAFLATVHADKKSSDTQKEAALGEFVVAIRKDLLSHGFLRKSKLTAQDFKVYCVT